MIMITAGFWLLNISLCSHLQERMKSALNVLRQKKDAFDKTKRNYEETVMCIQVKLHFKLND